MATEVSVLYLNEDGCVWEEQDDCWKDEEAAKKDNRVD